MLRYIYRYLLWLGAYRGVICGKRLPGRNTRVSHTCVPLEACAYRKKGMMMMVMLFACLAEIARCALFSSSVACVELKYKRAYYLVVQRCVTNVEPA